MRYNTLTDLEPGEVVVVRELTIVGVMRCRMLDIGLTPGAKVECICRSPLGDPLDLRRAGGITQERRRKGQAAPSLFTAQSKRGAKAACGKNQGREKSENGRAEKRAPS